MSKYPYKFSGLLWPKLDDERSARPYPSDPAVLIKSDIQPHVMRGLPVKIRHDGPTVGIVDDYKIDEKGALWINGRVDDHGRNLAKTTDRGLSIGYSVHPTYPKETFEIREASICSEPRKKECSIIMEYSQDQQLCKKFYQSENFNILTMDDKPVPGPEGTTVVPQETPIPTPENPPKKDTPPVPTNTGGTIDPDDKIIEDTWETSVDHKTLYTTNMKDYRTLLKQQHDKIEGKKTKDLTFMEKHKEHIDGYDNIVNSIKGSKDLGYRTFITPLLKNIEKLKTTTEVPQPPVPKNLPGQNLPPGKPPGTLNPPPPVKQNPPQNPMENRGVKRPLDNPPTPGKKAPTKGDSKAVAFSAVFNDIWHTKPNEKIGDQKKGVIQSPMMVNPSKEMAFSSDRYHENPAQSRIVNTTLLYQSMRSDMGQDIDEVGTFYGGK